MANEFNLDVFIRRLEKLKQVVTSGKIGDAMVGAMNTGNALMQQRIFNQNKDIQGQDFGVYIGKKTKISERTLNRLLSKASATDKKRIKSAAELELTPYQRKRANKGRQIAKKDLEFTGAERRSIETQIETEKVILQFNNDLAAKIAKGQEQQIHNIRSGLPGTTKGTGAPKIFALDKNEKEQVIDQVRQLIKQLISE